MDVLEEKSQTKAAHLETEKSYTKRGRWGKYTDLTRSQPTAYKDKLEVQCNQLKVHEGCVMMIAHCFSSLCAVE